MIALVFLAWLQQEPETILKAQKLHYTRALDDCEKAEAMLATDPRQAIETLSAILENPKIEKREVRLRYEIQSGSYSRWYDFYPYQFRGRARMELAARSPDQAVRLLQGAVEDLQESVRLGHAPSEGFLKTAKDRLAAAKSAQPAPDPAGLLKDKLDEHVAKRRFRSAARLLETEGAALSAQERSDHVKRIANACRQHVEAAADAFVEGLAGLPPIKRLLELKRPQFDAHFFLPPETELVVLSEEYQWCAAVRQTFLDAYLAKRTDPWDDLLKHAVAAVPFAARDKPRPFEVLSQIAGGLMRDWLAQAAETARTAPPEARARLVREADAMLKRWLDFERRLEQAAKPLGDGALTALQPQTLRLREALTQARDEFPVDATEEIRQAVRLLNESADKEDPEGTLRHVEQQFDRMLKAPRRYSTDQLQAIAKHRVVAAALRGLLREETALEIARDLSDLRDYLGALPPSETAAYGSKVAEVFKELLSK